MSEPDIKTLKAQRDALAAQLADLDAQIAEALAPKDPPSVQEEAALWVHAISIVDATEVRLRGMIMQALEEIAGQPTLSLAAATAATNTLMAKVSRIRAKAIRAAFRKTRGRLGQKTAVYGKSLAVWAQMITASDLQGITSAIQGGLATGLSHVEITRKVVGSPGLRGVDGVTEMTRHKLAHVGRASIKQRRKEKPPVDGTA